jgi:uncharacterized protein YdaU (DUF1376 family)
MNARTGKSPAFQFFAADFLADENVALMSTFEIGTYVLLLLFAWREGSIPANENDRAKLCRSPVHHHRKAWERVKRCWQTDPENPDRLINSRLERERSTKTRYVKAQSERARKRWDQRLPFTDLSDGNPQVHRDGNCGKPLKLKTRDDAAALPGQCSASASASASAMYKKEQASPAVRPHRKATGKPQTRAEDGPAMLSNPQGGDRCGDSRTRDGPQVPLKLQGPSERLYGDSHRLSTGLLKSIGMPGFSSQIDAQKNAQKNVATKLIDKLRAQGFDAGKWWGKCREPEEAKLAALILLSIRYDRNDPPKEAYAYLTKTVREKRANLAAAKAEAENNRLKKATLDTVDKGA